MKANSIGPRHTLESVIDELAGGLRDGSVELARPGDKRTADQPPLAKPALDKTPVAKRPLDRQVAALYGRFVNAAYMMFKRDRAHLRPEPQPGDIPEPYELVAWVNMSDFTFWLREIPKFYGIICRHREQKHNFILAIRGTESGSEWFDDVIAFLVPFRHVPYAGRVASGFDRIYSTLRVVRRQFGAKVAPSVGASAESGATPDVMLGSFAQQLEQLADMLEEPVLQDQIRVAEGRRPRRSFVVTGHSLGAALATLFVMENAAKHKFDISTFCTFASPRVGNTEFVRLFNLLPLDSWRIVNTQDIVPKIPLHLPLFDYNHVATEYAFSSAGDVKGNPFCWHSMNTYLHWLDTGIDISPACKR